jgi:agmatinase
MSTLFDPGAAALAESGIYGLPFTAEEARVVVVPAPFAATTSYGGGAQRGPEAILRASHQVDLFDVETGRPYEVGISMLPISEELLAWHEEARPLAEAVIEVGGLVDGNAALEHAQGRVNEIGAKVNDRIYETVRGLLAKKKLVALVGGDHSTPYGAIRAHAEAYPGLGILHVDAHADLRKAYEGFTHSHASIMHNVTTRIPEVGRVVQVGIRDLSEAELEAILASNGRIVTYFDADLASRKNDGVPWSTQVEQIVSELPRNVYVSFDIDGLDPQLCPHTGTPVPGGLLFHEATSLVAAVARSGRTIVGLDVNEIVPGEDGDEWDANVGARLLYKMMGWMLVSQGLLSRPKRTGDRPPHVK